MPDPTAATRVAPDSPAIEVMTDLRRVAPLTIGLFSLTQVARQLGVTPSTPDIGRTFAEIEAAVRGG